MKTLKLNNGCEIPIVGLGTFKSEKGEVATAVKDAIDAGYRHFDCAFFYLNEDEIGTALQEKLQEETVTRQELFITTKLWNNYHAKQSVMPILKRQLKSLKLDYVDLYLMHWPFGIKEDADLWPVKDGTNAFSDVDYLETWESMEECVRQGLACSIGVSNFNSEQIARLFSVAKIKPVVNQIEVNPNINQKKLIQFCKERDIVVTGYCPLGRIDAIDIPGVPKPSILDERVLAMRDKYKKTSAQIILNYLINLGITVVPKTVKKARMIENLDVFDFVLEQSDREYLDSLNKNVRICAFTPFKDHKYFPFHIEFY